MINYVIINGVNSNTINGLGINELPPISKPSMRVLTEEIDGRDGDITTNLGYSAYDKTITIGLFGTGYDINNIISFFNGEGTIVFSNEDDKYYKYKIINQIDYEALLKFKQATITFHCQPFKYPLEEEPLEIEYDYIEQTGETLTLNNTGEATLDLSLKGNTSQTGTPTPSSPIPINVVSGDNEVVVCGKNLSNITSALPYFYSAGLPTDASTKITINSFDTTNISFSSTTADYQYVLTNAIQLKPNTQYTIKFSRVTGVNSQRFYIYDYNNGTYTINYQNNTNDSSIQTTFTTNSLGQIVLAFGNGNVIGTTKISNIMLNEGNEAISYEPYTGQIFPLSLTCKNLFDKKGLTFKDGYYLDDNGAEQTNSAIGYTSNIKVQPSTQYTIQGTLESNDGYFRMYYFDSSQNWISRTSGISVSSIPYTFTTPNNCYYIGIQYQKTALDKDTIQLEKGSQATSFQPYTTPIELCKIGDYQDYFTKNSGKNLLNVASLLSFAGSKIITFDTPLEIGSYTLSISGWQTSGANASSMLTFNYDDNTTISTTLSNNDKVKSLSFEKKVSSVKIFSNSTDENSGSITATFTNMQLEKGSQTSYEPYGTGLWCKYNAIGKVVLDGSEANWGKHSSSTGTRYRYWLNDVNFQNVFTNCLVAYETTLKDLVLCNEFKAVAFANTSYGKFSIHNLTSSNCFYLVNLDDTTITSVEEYKTWLGTHNEIVYYPLKTPYLSLIEDTTLISQLDNIQNAMSYEGQTNVMQVNDDKPFIIDAKALEQGSDEVVVNNIGNATSKPLIALEGTGNINIYLDGTQVLQANVEDKMNIDIDKLEAYNPDTSALLNRQVTGNYNSMTLPRGNSTIKIDGNLTSATITNYTRWL